ncbi:MAG: hypothetical protein IPO27_10980 [Bacteroidetes bacterium]|nr:hypothetical protein [Bacteroidota bacterium]
MLKKLNKKFFLVAILAFSLFAVSAVINPVQAQQANTVKLVTTGANDYVVKVYAPAIYQKISGVSQSSFQKKYKSIDGIISINRNTQDYFTIKLTKTNGKAVLKQYFKLTAAQVAILP